MSAFPADDEPLNHLAIPQCNLTGRKLLDVGCRDGRDLMMPEFDKAIVYGVDISSALVEAGRIKYPGLRLSIGAAEQLPYPARFFEVLMSRVTLPYTDIPKAIDEMARVMAPGAHLFLTLHDFRYFRWQLLAAIKTGSIKRIIDHVYIAIASVVFNAFGKVIGRPWKPTRETCQMAFRMRKLLVKDFALVVVTKTEKEFIVTGTRKAGD
jgi:ubiquinone/menaquinone biosynthesis C-methylase UbiE